jgi:hypothetical protein
VRTPLLLLLLLAFTLPAHAHKASDGFIYLDQSSDDATTVRIDLALRDLALVVALDTNDDRQVTGAEVTQAREDITTYIESGVTLFSEAGRCQLKNQGWGITRHSDGPYAAARYQVNCPNGEPVTAVEYKLLFEVDSLHRGLLQHQKPDGEQLAVLGPNSPRASLSAGSQSLGSSFIAFLQQGIVHLLFGYDHVLFLLVLMLPATLRHTHSPHSPVGTKTELAQRLWKLAGIVTAFTVAHSITLALAALDVVRPPIAFIEILIALSIAVAALNLIWPLMGEKTWRLAFGFGLIHGFGFASVLADLTSGTSQTVVALAGFNIGVEVGQLGLLLVLFPLFYAVGHYRFYQRAAVPAIAVVVTVISLYWAVDRFAML